MYEIEGACPTKLHMYQSRIVVQEGTHHGKHCCSLLSPYHSEWQVRWDRTHSAVVVVQMRRMPLPQEGSSRVGDGNARKGGSSPAAREICMYVSGKQGANTTIILLVLVLFFFLGG